MEESVRPLACANSQEVFLLKRSRAGDGQDLYSFPVRTAMSEDNGPVATPKKRLGPGAIPCVNVRRVVTVPPSVSSTIPMSSPD